MFNRKVPPHIELQGMLSVTRVRYPAMGEENTESDRGSVGRNSGWITTKVAAASLGVTPRTIRTYIHSGELEGREEREGINKRLLVSITSLDELRVRRETEGKFRTKNRRSSERGESRGDNIGDMAEVLRELSTRLERRAAEAADLRARLELTAEAESTLRERLEQERERAAQEQARAEEAQRDAEQFIREREEAQEETRRLREELESERSKGFWRRLFGG